MATSNKDKVLLGTRIAFYRQKAGMTQMSLAQKSGITKSYMSKIEKSRGEKLPSLQTLFSIAEVLGCPVARFFQPVQED